MPSLEKQNVGLPPKSPATRESLVVVGDIANSQNKSLSSPSHPNSNTSTPSPSGKFPKSRQTPPERRKSFAPWSGIRSEAESACNTTDSDGQRGLPRKTVSWSRDRAGLSPKSASEQGSEEQEEGPVGNSFKHHHLLRVQDEGESKMRRNHSALTLKELPNGMAKSVFRPFEEEYMVGSTLGTGGYAVVMEATHKATGIKYAVKIMKIGKAVAEVDEEDEDEEEGDEEDEEPDELSYEQIIDNEIGLVQRLNHPNIIKLKEYFINLNKCYIVMDILEGPVLLDALLQMGKYTEKDAKAVFARLLDAVAYMHLQNVVHRDLKLENLVLKTANQLESVVIVDFGFAKAARARETMQDVVGTPWYSAPELLLCDPYTEAVDLWALGVGMYMLLCGEFPFDDPDEEVLEQQIIDGFIDLDRPMWQAISPEAKDLLRGLLSTDPKQRPTAAEALEHAWFTGFSSHTASSLHCAHTRLRELAACTRLPTLHFQPGDHLVTQGERGRGKAVYMIMSGEAEVLLRRPAAQTQDDTAHAREEENGQQGSEPAASLGDGTYLRMGTRRAGNFVGDLGVSASSSRPLVSWRPGPGENEGEGEVDAPQAAPPSVAMMQWRVLLTVFRAANLWRGKRRKFTVRALTPVSVVVLNQEDMQWAVEHDYRLSTELQEAMKKQRKVVRRNLKREQKQKLAEAETTATWGGAGGGLNVGIPSPTESMLSSLCTPRTMSGVLDPVTYFKQTAQSILREYFISTDVGEVAAQLAELDAVTGGGKMAVFVKHAVCIALDCGMRERELVALLMSALTPALITPEDLLEGFRLLLDQAQDLSLDIPDAADVLTLFTARAIVDEILPPSSVSKLHHLLENNTAASIATAALNLVQARHSTERILVAWGGGQAGTVAHSKERMADILREFLSTHSIKEAADCLHALKVNHFHHEFVKKALTMGIENPTETDALVDLLFQLHNMGMLVDQQIQMGFARMRDYVEDLELDVPGACTRLNELEAKASVIGMPIGMPSDARTNLVVET